jgi:hypothetical protein
MSCVCPQCKIKPHIPNIRRRTVVFWQSMQTAPFRPRRTRRAPRALLVALPFALFRSALEPYFGRFDSHYISKLTSARKSITGLTPASHAFREALKHPKYDCRDRLISYSNLLVRLAAHIATHAFDFSNLVDSCLEPPASSLLPRASVRSSTLLVG